MRSNNSYKTILKEVTKLKLFLAMFLIASLSFVGYSMASNTYAANYTITFNPQGGTFGGTTSNSTKTVTTNSTTNNSVGAATRSGYTFTGWWIATSGGAQVYNSSGVAVAGNGVVAPSTNTNDLPYVSYNCSTGTWDNCRWTEYYGLGYYSNSYYYADQYYYEHGDGYDDTVFRLYRWNGSSWTQLYNEESMPTSASTYYSAWTNAWSNRNASDHGASVWPSSTSYWSSGGTAPTTTSMCPSDTAYWSYSGCAYGMGYYSGYNYYALYYSASYDGNGNSDDYLRYQLYQWNGSSWSSVYSSGSGSTGDGSPPASGSTYYSAWTNAWGHRSLSDHGASYLQGGGATWVGTSSITVYAQWTKNVSSLTSSISPTSYIYDGSGHCPTPTVQDGTTTLTNGTHYNISCLDNISVGSKTLSISGASYYNSTTMASYVGNTSKTYYINNATLTFDATTNGGTLSGTSPLYTKKGATGMYTGIRNTTAATAPTASKSNQVFNGWYTASSGGTKVLNANGTLTGTAVSGYTTASAWDTTQNRTLYAQFSDTTAPSCSISRSDYNTFSWSASDNVGIAGYAVTNSSSAPTSWTSSTSTSGTYDISSKNTWYIWVKDAAGNTCNKSINSYTVTRSQGAGTTLTTKYDSNGSSFTTSPTYVLNGTPINVSASLNSGYANLSLTRNGSAISSGGNYNITGDTAFASSATLTPTLTFNPNGGTVSPSSMGVTYPSLPTNLPTPSKSGNDFRGWYANIGGSSSNVINMGRGYNYTNVISIHISAYMADWSTLNNTSSSIAMLSCTESGGFEIDFEGGTAKHMDYYLMIGSSYVHFSSGQYWGVNNITSGWHTWDLVYDGSTVTGYYDGAVFNSQSASGSISYNSTANLYVGAEANASSFDTSSVFPGYVGNVVIKNQGTRIVDSTVYNTWSAPAQAATLYAHYEATPKPTPTLTFNTTCGSVSPTSMVAINGTNTTNLPTPTGCAGHTFKGWYSDFNGSSTYLNLGRDYMYTDKISIHLSVYMANWSSYQNDNMRVISCTEGGGWNIEMNNNYIQYAGYDSGVGYKVATSSVTWQSLSSGWHDLDMVFDGTYLYGYLDGNKIATSAAYTSHAIGYNTSNAIFVGAEAGSSSTTPAGQYFNGRIGNVIISHQNTKISADTYNTISPPIANLTLNARWDVNSYNLKVDPNGGTWNGSKTVSSYIKTYGSTESIPAPTRTGYSFVGWAEAGGGSLSKLTNSDPSFDSSVGGVSVYNNSGNGMVTHTMSTNGANLLTDYDTSFLSYNDGATTLFSNQMNSGTEEIVSGFEGSTKALHLHSLGGNGRVYRTLSLTAGHTYTWSADFYSTSVSAPYYAMHTEMNGGDYSWSGTWKGYNTPGKWERLSITWTPTSNTTLYYFFHCPTDGDTYIKNIKIEEGGTETAYTASSGVSPYGNRNITINTLNGTTSPGLGGFIQNTGSAANKKYIHTFVAKIPSGYSVEHYENATGDNRVITWLTSTAGTGKYEVYAYEHDCGSSGTFSTFGHVAIVSGNKPMNWDLAYSHMFDITSGYADTYTYGAGDGKLTALWVPKTYSIAFNANGGTGTMSDITIREDESKTLTSNVFAKRGYTFSGWNTKTDGTGVSYDDREVVKNIIGEQLTKAQQVGNGWGMTYPASGVSAPLPYGYSSYAYAPNRDATLPTLTATAGKVYKITGYGIANSSAQSPATVGFQVNNNGNYSWPPGNYLPTSTNGWSKAELVYTVASGTTSIQPWVQTNGWPSGHTNYNGSNGVGGWYWTGLSVRDMGVTSTTLYAQYTPMSYTVNYSCGTGSGTPATSQTVNYDSTFTTATTAGSCSKTGYSFAGYKDPTGVSWTNWSGAWVYIDGQYGISNNTLTLAAQWTPNKYTITYDYQTTPATSFVDAASYEDTGYLVNWDEDFTITGSFTPVSSGQRHLVIGSFDDGVKTLNIEVNTSNKMRVYLGTGTIDSSSSASIGQFNTEISYTFTWVASTKAYTLTATGTGTNISMNGTYSGASGVGTKTLLVGRADHRTESTPFTTVISARNLKISRKYTYGDTLSSLPTPATRLGYTFNGWWTATSGGSQVFASTAVPASNTTYYARWSHTKLRVTETVKGNQANVSKDFEFTITVQKSGTGINGTYAYTGSKSGNLVFSSGNASFTLHHGQYIDVYFPTGYTYTIVQDDDGYALTKTNDTGTFGNDVTAAFTDTLGTVTPTGITIGIFPYIILLLVSVVSTFLIGKFKDI